MVKRRMGMIAFLLYVCLCLAPIQTMAASTADAKELLDTDQPCKLTVVYQYNGVAFAGLTVKLYHVADVSADFQYTLTSPFLSTGLTLNGIRTNSEWNVIRTTLEAHIVASSVSENMATATDEGGQACFESLRPGLYLAVPTNTADHRFDPALIALPALGSDGLWQYDLTVASKGAPVPPAQEEITYKVLKLWKDSGNHSSRPKQIEVEIFRNGKSYQTVILSEENRWSYSWTAEDDGAQWMVAERNVPAGYTVTLDKREASFVLTNTKSQDPGRPGTGDTANLLVYVLLMLASGISLVALGIFWRKKCI